MTDEARRESYEERQERLLAEGRAHDLARDEAREKNQRAADLLNHERIAERDRLVREMLNATSMREQTAATILAALIRVGRGTGDRWRAETLGEAVALADALRAELARVPR